jgi:hypothetical protein
MSNPSTVLRVSCKPSPTQEVPRGSRLPNEVRLSCLDGGPLQWECLGGGKIDTPSTLPHRIPVPLAWRDVPVVVFDV